MLVLTRKEGESLLIGDNIKVTIVRAGANHVRVGVQAPREVKVIREELKERENG